jgi:uncharacterized protein
VTYGSRRAAFIFGRIDSEGILVLTLQSSSAFRASAQIVPPFGGLRLLALFFGIISLLYATVGQAGGTAFLALMAFATFPSSEMRPTALALNILAAGYSTWVFNREKVVEWRKLRPFLLSSLPTALVGGFIVLDERVYKTTTGVVLLLAGVATILRRGGAAALHHECSLSGAVSVGIVIGLISGLTGVGGGVFLAPTLIALHWASRSKPPLYPRPSSWLTRPLA